MKFILLIVVLFTLSSCNLFDNNIKNKCSCDDKNIKEHGALNKEVKVTKDYIYKKYNRNNTTTTKKIIKINAIKSKSKNNTISSEKRVKKVEILEPIPMYDIGVKPSTSK